MRKVVNMAKMLRNEIPSTFVLDTSFFYRKNMCRNCELFTKFDYNQGLGFSILLIYSTVNICDNILTIHVKYLRRSLYYERSMERV